MSNITFTGGCPPNKLFLRTTAGAAVARRSYHNSVCPSVCHTGGSAKKRSRLGLPNFHCRLLGRL